MAETNSQSEETKEPIFFNVMPKAKKKSGIGDLYVSPSPSSPGSVKSSLEKGSGNTLKAFYIFTIVVFVAALAAGGYYAYKWRESRQNAGASLAPEPIKTNTKPLEIKKPNPEPPKVSEFVYTTPAEWQKRHFGAEVCEASKCADDQDPDNDGLNNHDEYASQTDPNDNDTDNDGIGDGDETNIFGTNPLSGRTAGNAEWTDADDLRGGYDSRRGGERMSLERILEIKELVKQFGLHEPTQTTLGEHLANYSDDFLSADVDQSPAAQLDRDTLRMNTIKKIGVALYSYHKDAGYYPVTDSFSEMAQKIKPYNTVATNYLDPINKPPFVYSYEAGEGGKDFLITYYSETQSQIIRYTSTNAAKDAVLEQANLNDDQRVRDLEGLRSALLIYSAANSGGTKAAYFPKAESYQADLAPQYIPQIPKDPKTEQNYEYIVNKDRDEFTVKAKLENPPAGSTGYLCNQSGCDTY